MERPLPVSSGYTVDCFVNADAGLFAQKLEAFASLDPRFARGPAQSFDSRGELAPSW